MQSIGCEDARYGESEATGEDEDSCNGKAIGNAACTRMDFYGGGGVLYDIGIPTRDQNNGNSIDNAACSRMYLYGGSPLRHQNTDGRSTRDYDCRALYLGPMRN